MSTLAILKKRVAAFMARSETLFVVSGEDLLTWAINEARRSAELQHNFELARTSVIFPSVSLSEGALLSSAKDFYSQQTPVSVKLIERAFVNDPHAPSRQKSIGVASRAAAVFMNRKGSRVQSVEGQLPFSLVQHGPRIYLSVSARDYFPSSTTIPVYADVVQWMPNYVNANDTDFFLTLCSEYILYRAVVAANFFLKEDQRVQVSAAFLERTWNDILQWDASIVAGTVEDVDLS